MDDFSKENDAVYFSRAWRECDWLIEHGETFKTRKLARKLKRLCNKAFKKAILGRYDGRYNEELWGLTTKLMADQTLRPEVNGLMADCPRSRTKKDSMTA